MLHSPWGPPRIKWGGEAQVTTDKYTVYTEYRVGAMILVRGGNIGKNFIYEFLSSPVLQWRRQNFGSGRGTFSTNVLIKDVLKNFEKLKTNLQKNFKKILQNYSKIKFNRI